MQVFTSLSEFKLQHHKYANIALALGTFDGIHIGHQNVILQAVKLAKEHGGTAAVLTFSNHPISVLNHERTPLIINDTPTKINTISQLGVDILLNIEFTRDLAQLSPHDFMAMLERDIGPKYVVTGPNYSFGLHGAGRPALLQAEGPRYGFQAYMHHFVYCQNSMVSSTLIRLAISDGDLERANKMLGRYFSIQEEVIHGKKRGRMLGFPTANLAVNNERLMLPNGVYIVYAYVRGQRYHAVASIGTNPTFMDITRRVEVNIFDFNENIYGEILRVDFVKPIRREIKFTSVDALLAQMKKDVKYAQEYLAKLD